MNQCSNFKATQSIDNFQTNSKQQKAKSNKIYKRKDNSRKKKKNDKITAWLFNWK